MNYFDITSCKQFPIKVKASILRLYNKKTKVCKHLFSVFECIESDMQIKDNHSVFAYDKKSNTEEKVFYTESVMYLDKKFISDPLCNFEIPDQNNNIDKFVFINSELIEVTMPERSYMLSNERTASGLWQLFPQTNNPTWIKAWIDKERATIKYIENDDKLKKQLINVSQNNLGFDLSKYNDYIGSIFLVWHHPYIRSIDLSGILEPKLGFSLDIDFRTHVRPYLRLEICQVEQGDCIANNQIVEIPNPGFRQFVELPIPPDFFLVRMYDEDNHLLYHHVFDCLIHQFGINISMPSKTIKGLSTIDTKGNVEKLHPIQKWGNERETVGKEIPSLNKYFSDAEKIREIDRDEKACNFIFFDGNKDRKELNKENAQNYVITILNKAFTRCMICDDFFDSTDFGSFLYPVKNENVELRVMSSLGDMHADCAMRLAKIVDDYNHAIGSERAKARMLKGKRSVLHDRFIVCDDDIWAVGASFNELGSRASVIYKIPHDVGLIIIRKLEEWWNDENISIDVHMVTQSSQDNIPFKQLLINIWHEIKKYKWQ